MKTHLLIIYIYVLYIHNPFENIVMLEQVITAYNEAVFDTDREKALEVIHDAVASGITPEDIVFKVVIPAMELMIKSISEDFDANFSFSARP